MLLDLELIADQIVRLDFTPFLLAVLVGGAIGLEREIHGRPAGLRTHTLVCLSATILIHASRAFPLSAEDATLIQRVVYDPNRLGAGIVTGIGFLGAAAVIRSGDIVRGITTGACVWAVASLGVVIGHGLYGLAVVAASTMLLVLVIFDRLFGWVTPVVYRCVVIRGERTLLREVSERVQKLLRGRGIKVQDLSCDVPLQPDPFRLAVHIRCRNRLQATELTEAICGLEGVISAEWRQISL